MRQQSLLLWKLYSNHIKVIIIQKLFIIKTVVKNNSGKKDSLGEIGKEIWIVAILNWEDENISDQQNSI